MPRERCPGENKTCRFFAIAITSPEEDDSAKEHGPITFTIKHVRPAPPSLLEIYPSRDGLPGDNVGCEIVKARAGANRFYALKLTPGARMHAPSFMAARGRPNNTARYSLSPADPLTRAFLCGD